MDASVFDAIAVLIAVVSLGQLPFGLSVGAAAAVLILGPQGVAAATAAGVLLTATGTVGSLPSLRGPRSTCWRCAGSRRCPRAAHGQRSQLFRSRAAEPSRAATSAA